MPSRIPSAVPWRSQVASNRTAAAMGSMHWGHRWSPSHPAAWNSTRRWPAKSPTRSLPRSSVPGSCPANPQHPRLNTLSKGGRSARYGRQRLFEVLQRFELWDETLALAGTPYLEPTGKRDEQLKRLRLMGKAHFGKESMNGLGAIEQEIVGMLGRATKAQMSRIADGCAHKVSRLYKCRSKSLSIFKASLPW